MISLVFVICTQYSCISASPPQIFKDIDQCEDTAYSIIEDSQRRADLGEVLPHKAIFKCFDWGVLS